MKTIRLIMISVVFLVLCTNEIQVQPTQTKLDQVELMKQIISSWKCETGKDAILTLEVTPFGNL